MSRIPSSLLTLAVLAACASAPLAGTFVLEGKILDDGGAVYDNVELSLCAPDGTVLQTTQSGGGGVFTFPDLPIGRYRIVLDAENQPDGPLPVQPVLPMDVTIGPRGLEGGPLVLRLTSVRSTRERLYAKYAADMAHWDTENADPANRGAVVFAGSSSIRLWSTLRTDFPRYTVVNRGFGGSTAAELRQVLDKVLAIQPRAVVIYEGDNDLAQEGSSVTDFLGHMEALTRELEAVVRKDRILILSIKPSRSRAARWPVFRQANAELQKLALAHGYTFVDVSTPMLEGDRVNDVYIGHDGLHLSAEGYRLWTSVLTPVLDRVLR